jgi:hypothetical protein
MYRIPMAVTLLALLPAFVYAQPQLDETRWSASAAVGFDLTMTGDATSTVSGSLAGTPIVLGNVAFSDVYGTLARLHFSAGYRIDDQSEVLGAFSYSGGNGSRQTVGVAPGPALVGEFTGLGEKSVEVGYRYHFPARNRWYPYATAWGGFTRAGRVNSNLSVPAVSLTLINLPVFDDTTTGTLAIGGGVIVPVTRRVGISADASFRWRAALNGANALVGTGLEGIGGGSARWSLPVVFGAVVRFGEERP